MERKTFLENSPKTRKKFREHAQIPEEDSLSGQKKKIRKKQTPKTDEKRAEKNPEGYPLMMKENQMVKGPGMKPEQNHWKVCGKGCNFKSGIGFRRRGTGCCNGNGSVC